MSTEGWIILVMTAILFFSGYGMGYFHGKGDGIRDEREKLLKMWISVLFSQEEKKEKSI